MLNRFKPYARYLGQVKGSLAAAIFYAIIYGITSGFTVPVLVDKVFPLIFENYLAKEDVMQIIMLIPMVFFLRCLSAYRNSFHTQSAGVNMLEAIRLDYFRKLQVLPMSFIQKHSSGDLISRGLADTAQLQNTLTIFANDGVKQPFTLVGALGAVVWLAATQDGVGRMLAAMTIIPLTVLPVRYVGRKVIKRAAQLQAHLGDTTGYFNENLSAAREVRTFNLEQHSVDRFRSNTEKLVTAQLKLAKYALALTPAIELLSAGAISTALYMAYGHGVDFKTFSAILLAIYFCYEPIKKLGGLSNELRKATASLDRLEMVLKEPVSIRDPEKPVPIGRLQGNLSFRNLSFAYKEGETVLDKLSMEIPAGTVCALVGQSGSGKSTFANLVPRLYEATQGQLCIDGIDVREMRLHDLRNNIAIVSQEPVLFNDTIYNNLLLGRPDATRQEVEQAARDAFAHDFILTLEGGLGYETMVGERGSRLSGGQKQRVALARAFLRNAPILILDEATSALDTASEAFIQEALRKLMAGRTVLIIAHRFSTIRDANLILVFDKNARGIAASGSHAQLYRDNPTYRELCDKQGGAQETEAPLQ